MTTRLRTGRTGRLGPLLALTLGLAALPACDPDRAAQPEELSGWKRTQVYSHHDVVDYDVVRAASDGRSIAWFTRARGRTDELAVAAWPATRNVDFGDVPRPEDVEARRLFPAVMAVSENGWTAVASRSEPGKPVSFVTWSGQNDESGEHASLEIPRDQAFAGTVVAARSREVAVVLALTGPAQGSERGVPEPNSLVLWTAPIDRDGVVDPTEWKHQPTGFETNGPFRTVALAGAGEAGLLLSGVTDKGTPSVWTSADGQAWKEIEAELPAKVDTVDLVAEVGTRDAVIAWSVGGIGGQSELWRFDGSTLAPTGTIHGPEQASFDLTSAAIAGGRLVVGGSILRADTWSPTLWAYADEKWIATDQPELVGGYDWSIEALAANGDNQLNAVMVSTPFHIDVATWTWRRPTT